MASSAAMGAQDQPTVQLREKGSLSPSFALSSQAVVFLPEEHRRQSSKGEENRSNTFQILSRQEDRAQVVVFDERADLRADRGTIKAHHKELTHLPGIATWLVSIISCMVTAASGIKTSRRGNSLNRE